jgi:hypothetical protein
MLGDVAYPDAFKGANHSRPAYDSQETVYNGMQTLLSEAIAELGQPAGGLRPASGHVRYRGDAGRWIAAARTLKARYALHLSKIDPQKAATDALNALYDGVTQTTWSRCTIARTSFSSATYTLP